LRARIMREGIMPNIGGLSLMLPLQGSGEIPATLA
jgi:hypothetical protein